MAAKTGSGTKIGVAITNVWGTAQAAGAEDKWEVENFTMDEGAGKLQVNPIGSGNDMANEMERGATSPVVGPIGFVQQYEGPSLELEALLFGATSAAPMAMGDGVYSHSILYNETRPSLWATVARQLTTDQAQEMPSGLPSRLTLRYENPPAYVMGEVELLGDSITSASPTNTHAVLETVTLEDSKRVVVKPSDKYRINAQAGGALADGDKIDVTSLDISFERVLEHTREIRNATASNNGEPRQSGDPVFVATIVATFRNLGDAAFAYFAAQLAGTEYKADLHVIGDVIGGTQRYSIIRSWPRLKIISFPQYALGSPGENPFTVTFEALVAASNPTGMISTKPYSIWQNTRTVSALQVG